MLVAVLIVALLAVTAFSVDLGLAYSGSRQLSTAADAAALAAGEALAENATTGCAAGIPTPALTSAEASAVQAAQNYVTSNEPNYLSYGPNALSVQVGCAGSPGDPVWLQGDPSVTVTIGGSSATTVGRITGTQRIAESQSATAVVGPSDQGSGLLPLAVCGSYLTTTPATWPTVSGTPLPIGTTTEIDFPKATSPCVTGGTLPGNWYKLNLDGSGTPPFERDLNGGCTCSKTLDFTSPSLTGGNGQRMDNIANDLGKVVILPVFTQSPPKPGKSPFTFTEFVAGTLCEYNFSANSNGGGSAITGGDCLQSPYPIAASDYIGLKISGIISSGAINPNCANFALATCGTVRTTVLAR